MRHGKILGLTSLALVAFGLPPVHASPQTGGPAARLSAAAGGILDSDIGEAGSLAHEIDYASIPLVPGRAVEYRRRIAVEMQLAERAKVAAARLNPPL